MSPKRMMEDVDDGGEAVDEEESIHQIKIVRLGGRIQCVKSVVAF